MKPIRVSLLALLAIALVSLAACSSGFPSSFNALAGPAQAQTGTPTTAPGTPVATSTSTPSGPSEATVPAGTATSAPSGQGVATAPSAAATPLPLASATTPPNPTASAAGQALASDLQTAIEQVYQTAGPSVVNIQVTSGSQVAGTLPDIPATPGTPSNPHAPGGAIPLPQQSEGSGFVWDQQGNIVTNNHVVEGADQIVVTFHDGTSATATLVGRDPDSDLAVIKVNPTGLDLRPVILGDSTQVKPGQFVIAIGNPFGLEGTMTFGIVSALGRSLPAQSEDNLTPNQATYTIPDVIQTDAPINPGNSGGVLLDLQSRVVGVTSAIASPVRANSGVGFAVPSVIVQKVVPSLIQTGKAEHPYLGISGRTLSPALAQAMNLNATQRGALIGDVAAGSPAEKAGLRGSTRQVTINGLETQVGGDVIVRIDNEPVQRFEDLTSYLARNTRVGQTVVLTVLRDGQQTTANVTLANRPAQAGAVGAATPGQGTGTPAPAPTGQARGRGYLGVAATTLTQEIAQAMNLNANQRGALIQSVTAGSPADQAGLQAGTRNFTTSGGQTIRIGGDVIVAVNNTPVDNDQDLSQAIGSARAGETVTVTVLRNGSRQDVSVTLAARPTQ